MDSQRAQIIKEVIESSEKAPVYQGFVILSKGSLWTQTNFCKGFKKF